MSDDKRKRDKERLLRLIRELMRGPDFGDTAHYARTNANRRRKVWFEVERIIDKYI